MAIGFDVNKPPSNTESPQKKNVPGQSASLIKSPLVKKILIFLGVALVVECVLFIAGLVMLKHLGL